MRSARIERLERAIDEAVKHGPGGHARGDRGASRRCAGSRWSRPSRSWPKLGELSRFTRAPQLMGYSGMGAREDSSGARTRRGGITKTGNAHLRRIVIEAAWAYRHRPAVGGALRKRQATLSEEVKAIGWKAQLRLHARYRRLLGRGKCPAAGRHGGGPRALGLHLGDRDHRGARTADAASDRRVAHRREKQKAATMAAEGHTERRTLERPMR